MKGTLPKRPAPDGRAGPSGPAKGGGSTDSSLSLQGGMEEAARHCRRIAADLNADGFGLLVSVVAGDRALRPLFDCDHPRSSPLLASLLAAQDGEIARHALRSSAPLRWEAKESAADGLSALPWTVLLSTEGPPHAGPGIAFPCYPERGPPGVVAFWGRRIALGPAMLCTVHARCFALFEAVSLLRAEGATRPPQMSKRELECLTLTAQGRTSEEIAQLLGLSVHTTNQHLACAAQKLNAVNRIHAVAKAVKLGLIE